jgi:hypothetical protein
VVYAGVKEGSALPQFHHQARVERRPGLSEGTLNFLPREVPPFPDKGIGFIADLADIVARRRRFGLRMQESTLALRLREWDRPNHRTSTSTKKCGWPS